MMTLEDQITYLASQVEALWQENLERTLEIQDLKRKIAEPPKRGPGRPPKIREASDDE